MSLFLFHSSYLFGVEGRTEESKKQSKFLQDWYEFHNRVRMKTRNGGNLLGKEIKNIWRGFESIVHSFFSSSGDDPSDRFSLWQAILKREWKLAEQLLTLKGDNLSIPLRDVNFLLYITVQAYYRHTSYYDQEGELYDYKVESLYYDSEQRSARLKVIKFLIEEKGADPNTTEGMFPPIQAAVFSGDPDIVKYLLEKGARVDSSAFGKTTLEVAEMQKDLGYNKSSEIIDILKTAEKETKAEEKEVNNTCRSSFAS